MKIEAQTLQDIEVWGKFEPVFTEYVKDVLKEARLFPKFSPQRIRDAHGAWLSDLTRVDKNEPNLGDGLDHFKRCGHLAFWIRRMSPLVDVVDLTANIADAPGYDLTNQEIEFRGLLYAYGNEYLAFDFGYQFCRFYELRRGLADKLVLGPDYLITICHFLKYKTVSPHALYLIYKSLFAINPPRPKPDTPQVPT